MSWALESLALVSGLFVDLVSTAVNFEALTVLKFVSLRTASFNAFSVDEVLTSRA